MDNNSLSDTKAPAIGALFSQNYLKRDATLKDSARARRRLYVLFLATRYDGDDYASPLEGKTGTKVPTTYYGHDWEEFFERGKLRDVLDSVTVFWRSFQRGYANPTKWLAGVREIFAEEALGYRVDDQGGVHLLVDREFQRDRTATLTGLGASRFAAAKASFDACHASLDRSPPDTKDSVRQIFDAIENVFKLMAGGKAARLGASEIDQHLAPMVRARYQGPALNYAQRMLAAFKEWTNSAHQYRHAPGTEEPSPPPLELAILAVSTGSNFLRWLLDVDAHSSALAKPRSEGAE